MLANRKLMPVKVILYLIILFVSVFLIAGTINYWQGWVFCILYSIFIMTYLYLLRNKQDLIKERIKPGPGVKWWDKIILKLLVFLGIAVYVLSIIDAGRYHWSLPVPLWLYVVNIVVYVINTFLCLYAMSSNNFFSSVVRIQTDREHKVVSNGLYRVIRHPGYAFANLSLLSLPIVLGSVWGLLPAVISVLLLVFRTHLEDKTLQIELKGYREYSQKTKYRLLPFLW